MRQSGDRIRQHPDVRSIDMELRSKRRYQVQMPLGAGLLATGVLLRFAFHHDGLLPVYLGVLGVWLLLHAIRAVLGSRPGTEKLYRKGLSIFGRLRIVIPR
jgi:hypothetical protein